MSLERIVRPFQTGEISPPRIVPAAQDTTTQDNVIIYPGHRGSVRTFSGNYSLTVNFYFIKKPREKRSGQGGYDPYANVNNNPQYDSGGPSPP